MKLYRVLNATRRLHRNVVPELLLGIGSPLADGPFDPIAVLSEPNRTLTDLTVRYCASPCIIRCVCRKTERHYQDRRSNQQGIEMMGRTVFSAVRRCSSEVTATCTTFTQANRNTPKFGSRD